VVRRILPHEVDQISRDGAPAHEKRRLHSPFFIASLRRRVRSFISRRLQGWELAKNPGEPAGMGAARALLRFAAGSSKRCRRRCDSSIY